MFKDAMAALLETPEGRRLFRVSTHVLLGILIIYLATLLAIAGHRAYYNAHINVWGLDIGPVPDGGGGATDKTADTSDVHNIFFEWRTANQTWETDAECEAALKPALASMKLSEIAKNEGLFFGKTKAGMVLASCYGEYLGQPAVASVVSFGKEEDVRSSAATFLAMMSSP